LCPENGSGSCPDPAVAWKPLRAGNSPEEAFEKALATLKDEPIMSIEVFTKGHPRANRAWNNVLEQKIAEGVEEFGMEAFIEKLTVAYKKACNENADFIRANHPHLIKYLDD